MKHAQLVELEGVRDRVADHLAELRVLVTDARSGNPSDAVTLRECVQLTHGAMAALDVLGERIKRLRCDTAPCDRVDGLCPKCERSPT
ncbi:MAG: hypothetical protein M3Y79_09280 [Pseudomonadota bacterium]|nr:hypothetical protein [Pseudomonadota bacterium]